METIEDILESNDSLFYTEILESYKFLEKAYQNRVLKNWDKLLIAGLEKSKMPSLEPLGITIDDIQSDEVKQKLFGKYEELLNMIIDKISNRWEKLVKAEIEWGNPMINLSLKFHHVLLNNFEERLNR